MLEKQRIKHKQECQIEGKKEKQQVRNVRCAAVQMCCSRNVAENIEKAEVLVRQAAAEGAQVILLPELFERQYFCQERRYDYYQFATPVMENPAVRYFQGVCASLQVVIPISFYERDVNRLFNSVAMIDADGSILGVYRKTHIPDDHFYQEKFILHREILVLRYLIQPTEKWVLASAGTSGFRRLPELWQWKAQRSFCIQQPLAVNPFFLQIVCLTGEDVCRDTAPLIWCL